MTRLPAGLLLPLASLIVTVAAEQARSASVVNGDFETGDFTGWSIETDGSAGAAPDFSIVASGGGFAARIEADYYSTAGDVASMPQDTIFIANTLHQPLDFSAEQGEHIKLSFDWTVGGEDGASSASEVFLVGLTDATGQMFGLDGQPGYLLAPARSYGSGSFSAALSSLVFNNTSGWSLEVQVLVGVDPTAKQHNAFGSYVEIDNVEVVAVPEPGVLASLGAGSALLLGLQRRRVRSRSRATAAEAAAEPTAPFRSRGRTARFALCLALLLGMTQATAARAWTDVSASAALTTNAKAIDRSAGVLFSYAQVTNQNGGWLPNLRLVVTQPSVPVANQDGWTAAAEPYFDLPSLTNGASATVRIEFPLARLHLDYGLRLDALPPSGEVVAITTAPSLTMDPTGLTPLAGLITATTNIPARVTLTATGTTDSFTVEFHEYTTDHSLPLLGLRTDSSYTVDLTFTDPDDNSVSSGSLVAVTGPLPVDMPDIDVLVSLPAQKEPGYTWVDRGVYALVFDQDAEVVWYSTISRGGTRKLSNGKLQWGARDRVVESDLLGNVLSVTIVQLAPLPEARLHHELFPTIYGTFLSLDREHVMVDDYPTSVTDPNAPTATKQLRDEPIVEFRADGTALKRYPLIDVIDPTRIWWGAAGTEPIDWAHTNSIVHDRRDDSVIVSAKNQNCIVKVDRVTGRLKWILGTPSNWTPQFLALRLQAVGPLEWQYGEHAAMITPNGNLLLFDNGNNRSSPFDPFPSIPDADNASRAVEYAIDEENMEVTQVWEWSGDFADRIFSRFLSDADALPVTGNVLIDFGGITHMGGLTTAALGYGTNVVRVIEVTHDTPGQVVLDIQLSDPVETVTSYRAEHWPSMYPPYATRTDQ